MPSAFRHEPPPTLLRDSGGIRVNSLKTLVVLLFAAFMLVGCGPSEAEKKLMQDRDKVLATAKDSAAKIAAASEAVKNESNQIRTQAALLQSRVEAQDRRIEDLSFAIRSLSETLGNIESEIRAREAAARQSGWGFWTWLIILAAAGLILFVLYNLLRSNKMEEDQDDFANFDDDLAFEDDMADGDKKGGDAPGGNEPPKAT